MCKIRLYSLQIRHGNVIEMWFLRNIFFTYHNFSNKCEEYDSILNKYVRWKMWSKRLFVRIIFFIDLSCSHRCEKIRSYSLQINHVKKCDRKFDLWGSYFSQITSIWKILSYYLPSRHVKNVFDNVICEDHTFSQIIFVHTDVKNTIVFFTQSTCDC